MPDATVILSTGASIVVAALALYFSFSPTPTPSKLPGHVRPPQLLVSSTFHSRFKPILHSFRYPVLYICLDLDSVGYVDRVFSTVTKAWRPLSLRSEDYLGNRYQGAIKQKLWAHMEDHGVDTSDLCRALLVTTPRLLGYSFNPVSFHYVYDGRDRLKVVVLEVNNTFGEKHVYVLRQDEARDGVRHGYDSAQTFPRRFHVSPFNDRSGSYQLQCRDPLQGEQFAVDMHLTLLEPDGTKKLTAQVNSIGAPTPTSQAISCSWQLLRHGTAVFLTVPRILLQAYRLHYGKKLAVYLRPEPFEDVGAIGRQVATSTDLYFRDLLVNYLRSNVTWFPCAKVVIEIVPAGAGNGRTITIDCGRVAGGGGDNNNNNNNSSSSNEDGTGQTLTVTVLSWSFFASLITSESPLTSLWTDNLSLSTSPLFRVSDPSLFLKVLTAGFTRSLENRTYLQRYRTYFRGRPDWFEDAIVQLETSRRRRCHRARRLEDGDGDGGDVGNVYTEYLEATNRGIDNFVYDQALKREDRRVLWLYRYRVLATLVTTHCGNRLFGAIATFAGDAGRPQDAWLRVRLALDREQEQERDWERETSGSGKEAEAE